MKKTIVQCDFDGTVTFEDVSFILLDAFADGDWRGMLQEYKDGRINVGAFNTRAFGLVKADEKSQLEYLMNRAAFKVRPGFPTFVDLCSRNNLKLVVVSNGLCFYIKAIMKQIGLDGVEIHAAENEFAPEGMKVEYIGPDGRTLEDGFKEAFAESFLRNGDRVVYIGNGVSDMRPARKAHHIFATDDLLASCRRAGVRHIPFHDFTDVVKGLEDILKTQAEPTGR